MKTKDMYNNRNSWLSLALILTVIFGGLSCTDLTEVSYTELKEDQFFQSEEDVQRAIAPIYAQLRQTHLGTYWNNWDLQEETSDILITPTRGGSWFDGGTYIRLQMHEYGESQTQPSNLWNNAYEGINNANRVLFQIENADFDIPNEEGVVAEIKVARAFYYHLLLNNFRNIPLITDFDVEEGYLPEQASPEEVFNFIESEIQDNLDLLSEQVDESTYGRFNSRWAALATLAELYLNAEVYIGEPMWEEVISVTDEIIDSGQFSLESNYLAPFAADNEGSDELVFAIPFHQEQATGSSGFHVHMKTLHQANQATFNLQGNPWNGMGVQPHFVDSYHSEDQRLEDSWIGGMQFAANGDTLRASQNDSLQGKPLVFENQLETIYDTAENDLFRIGKYEIPPGISNSLGNDFPYYRYADILMWKAEALLRSPTGSASEAANLVTQVRERSFEDPADALVTGAELEATTNLYGVQVEYGRMLQELGWEFAAEGQRRSDLIRFGVYTTGSWGIDHVPNGDHRKIFAIPDDALNRNSNLQQNPGY
jgi:hypothetical protein